MVEKIFQNKMGAVDSFAQVLLIQILSILALAVAAIFLYQALQSSLNVIKTAASSASTQLATSFQSVVTRANQVASSVEDGLSTVEQDITNTALAGYELVLNTSTSLSTSVINSIHNGSSLLLENVLEVEQLASNLAKQCFTPIGQIVQAQGDVISDVLNILSAEVNVVGAIFAGIAQFACCVKQGLDSFPGVNLSLGCQGEDAGTCNCYGGCDSFGF